MSEAAKRVKVADLASHPGQRVEVAGWVEVIRDQKAVQFVVLRDATGLAQLVHDRESDSVLAETISGLTVDSVVIARGTVELNERVKVGGLEVRLDSLEVLSVAEPLPIDERSGLDKRLDWRFIDLRRPRNRLIFEVQTEMEDAFRELWHNEGFIEIHSPKLMSSASESGAELFRVEYFDRFAYLAQSPQFYKQMAMAAGFDKVFEIGPVFRANPSFTSRHDTEFTSIDVEISWVESHEDVMAMEEAMLVHALARIAQRYGERIKDVFGVEVAVPRRPFPRVTLEQAREIVAKSGHRIERAQGDLDPEGERRVAQWVMAEYGHEFVFVTDYPASVRPFYHMRYPDAPGTTKSFDLLWKGLEITTGAQREHRYEILAAQAKEKGLDTESLSYYLNFFRFGCPPHGGFGLGLTRLLMVLLGVENVREVTYLYRGPNRLEP